MAVSRSERVRAAGSWGKPTLRHLLTGTDAFVVKVNPAGSAGTFR